MPKSTEIITAKLSAQKNRSYDILIGSHILDSIGTVVRKFPVGKNVFIITDQTVGRLYAHRVKKSFQKAGFTDIGCIQIAPGERSKTLDTVKTVLSKLHTFDRHQERKILIVTLGGGVVGDLGGLVAGLYKRGVPYIQIPTTLLGLVDCGLGGKVGVNLLNGKNIIGLFWQPKLVYMDITVLKTLHKREMKSGLAEAIKCAMIRDKRLFSYIEKNWDAILSGDENALKTIVGPCVRIKTDVVQRDERDEKDIRIILNFGHTVGHAVEAATDYSVYRHGEAIAVGMICAAELAYHLGMCTSKNVERLENLIRNTGLPLYIKKCTVASIMQSMKHDKKFVGGKNKFVLPTDIGKVTVRKGIDETLIRRVIKNRLR